jgi:hypothetical protein
MDKTISAAGNRMSLVFTERVELLAAAFLHKHKRLGVLVQEDYPEPQHGMLVYFNDFTVADPGRIKIPSGVMEVAGTLAKVWHRNVGIEPEDAVLNFQYVGNQLHIEVTKKTPEQRARIAAAFCAPGTERSLS